MEDISKGWGQPMMQPCGKEHFTCAECGRLRLRQILEQAKKPEPMAPLRPQLATFAAAMEATLKANDHKGGWSSMTEQWLWLRLADEVRELEVETRKPDAIRMMREAVDVANFAMMIYDIAAIRAAREGGK